MHASSSNVDTSASHVLGAVSVHAHGVHRRVSCTFQKVNLWENTREGSPWPDGHFAWSPSIVETMQWRKPGRRRDTPTMHTWPPRH
ncbi:uncharacterized protein SOCEGT47_006060 [Sorangium cellulosum]|uniref:Uncharacterized protein n=1 Tax=Sorangium cellulosum TaxID=56 RepID=A0A4V0NCS0_SORCE|nr:hypothetical protein [Sorangium cellulosum]AUX20142.1 uncharacterized protein SOCEGT47_006060 [Sorangium cellulosum]